MPAQFLCLVHNLMVLLEELEIYPLVKELFLPRGSLE